jgi:uncharacterized protein (DUF1499 family)
MVLVGFQEDFKQLQCSSQTKIGIAEAINYLLQKDHQEIEHRERSRIGYKNGDE